jgi:hypothetical protein
LTAFKTLWQTSLQQHVPLNVLSGVNAYASAASLASIPLSLALAARIAAIVGPAHVLVAAGIAPPESHR